MPTRFTIIVAVCITSLAAVLAVPWWARTEARERISNLNTTVIPARYDAIPAFVRSLRPIYPNSVIPGGVFSQQELKAHLQKDPVARRHYAEFDVADAKLVSLTQDRWQYVSYRLEDEVFWTSKRLRIASGEILLTDGSHFARTRCGNLLSETPNIRISPKEPTRMIDLPPMTEQNVGGQSTGLLSPPPDIQLLEDMPPRLTDSFVLPQLYGSVSAEPSPDRTGTAVSATGSPYIFATNAAAGKAPTGVTAIPAPPNQPFGQPLTPAPVSPVAPPLVPVGVMVPEPRFLIPIGITTMWLLLSRVARFKKPA